MFRKLQYVASREPVESQKSQVNPQHQVHLHLRVTFSADDDELDEDVDCDSTRVKRNA
jgi:hypothetical protein